MTKASSLLPPLSLDYMQRVQNVFAVGLGPHKTYKRHRDTIDRLTQAVDRHRTVQVRYYSASRTRMSRREIDPYRLWYASGGLYLIGYCHLRREPRMFAVERITSVTLTDHPYQLPLGFDLDAFVQDALTVMRGPRIEVELLFDKVTAAWVKDRTWHPSQRLMHVSRGRLRMTLSLAETRELTGWILSFGSGVTVIRPESVRSAVEQEAAKIVASS